MRSLLHSPERTFNRKLTDVTNALLFAVLFVWFFYYHIAIYIKYTHNIYKNEARELMEANKAYEKDHLQIYVTSSLK